MADRVMLADNKRITDEQIQRHLDQAGFLFGQPKIDGMRVYHGQNHIPQSRSGKEWKHQPLRAWCQDHPSMMGIDGEVIPGHIYTPDIFNQAQSGLRAEQGTREFTFYLFDHTHYADETYSKRYLACGHIIMEFTDQQKADGYHAKLVLCPTVRLDSLEQVHEFEAKMLADGWEGAMLRRPDLPYKFGRSTNVGGHLIKLKRYEDAEAIVIGYEPWEENQNEATLSPLGYTVRSAHGEGKVATERLGAWVCELATDRSVQFKVGVMQGVTHADRDRLWADRDAYIGRIFKFKHQGIGGYSKPRQPVFLNWRSSTEF